MTIDVDKWADRVYRPPKSGRDYTSARAKAEYEPTATQSQPTRHVPESHEKFEALDAHVVDMQLVINHLEQRIKYLENSTLEDQLRKTQNTIKTLNIAVGALATIIILAVVGGLVRLTETNLGALVLDLFDQLRSKVGL